MTEEQKNFKILKKTSYEQQVSKESKEEILYVFKLGLYAAAALVTFLYGPENIQTEIEKWMMAGLGLFESIGAGLNLKDLIQSICKKTMLQGKIEDICNDLEMPEDKNPEDKEIRGISR